MRIAVVGAGIAGITAAYYLAKRGYKVTVIEQERYPAMRTSFANGGQISVSNSEVWTTWKNVKKGIGWIFKKDAPLLIRLTPEWAKIKWLTKFLWHTFNLEYGRNTADTIRLGITARKLYKKIIEEEKLNFDFSSCGILHIYRSESYFHDGYSVKELYEANGCEWTILNSQQVIDKEPTIEKDYLLAGGAWTKDDSTGDIHKFCVELAQILKEKYSVEFVYGYTVENLDDVDMYDDFEGIVLANGVGSVALAKTVGDSLPIYPVKGYSITINLDEESAKYAPTVSLLDDEAKIVTARLGNRFRVAGTAELAGENYDIRKDRIQPLLDWVHFNFPKINTSNYSSWACLRPMTPNMMPIVEQSKRNPRVFYHTGHGHLGWTLSPATAELLVGKIVNTLGEPKNGSSNNN